MKVFHLNPGDEIGSNQSDEADVCCLFLCQPSFWKIRYVRLSSRVKRRSDLCDIPSRYEYALLESHFQRIITVLILSFSILHFSFLCAVSFPHHYHQLSLSLLLICLLLLLRHSLSLILPLCLFVRCCRSLCLVSSDMASLRSNSQHG